MTMDGAFGSAVSGNARVLLVVVATVLAAAAGGMAMTGSGQPTAEEVLTDARERYGTATTIVGTAVVTVGHNGTRRSAEVRFAVAEDNRTRVAVAATNRTVVAGSNGSTAWVHLENVTQAGVSEAPIHGIRDRLPGGTVGNARLDGVLRNASVDGPLWIPGAVYTWNVSHDAGDWNGSGGDVAESHQNRSVIRRFAPAWTPENATTERVGTETVGGIEAHLIEIEPAGDRDGSLRIWIATDDAAVLKVQFSAGERVVTVRYTTVRFGVSLADSTFRPPGDAQPETTTAASRAELQAATAFDLPALPPEYAFATGSTIAYGNATVVIQEYTGPANVTVVSTTADGLPVDVTSPPDGANATTRSLGGVTATVARIERGVVVSWEADGLGNAVVVPDSRERATAVAESIIEANE